ncbi:MAG: hypothetical protein V1884_01850, partial [Candidatus Omnitrophota bacterium]
KIFGRTVFKGVIDNLTYRAHFKPEDYKLSKLLFHEGLGAQSLIFILPSLFLSLPIVLLKRRKSLDLNLIYFLLLPFLIFFVYRCILPLVNTRYLYPLLGMGMVISFYTLQILGIPRQVINILTVLCALASMSELAKRYELVCSIALTFLLFSLSLFFIKQVRQKLNMRTFLPLILATILLLALLEKDYTRNEYGRYVRMTKYSGFWPDAAKAWDWLNSNTGGNNIAYVGRPVAFPLYGTNFKNNVYYVSVNRTDPAKLHYFPHSRYVWGYDFSSLHKSLEERYNYRGDGDYNIWLNNLAKRNTEYLFIYSLHQTKDVEFPKEDNWAINNPDKFAPVFKNETIHIYKIVNKQD